MYSNSTGVGLPKIETDTLSLDFSSSTSSTKPVNEAKGPSQTLTCSPTSKLTPGSGTSEPSFMFPKILSISVSETRTGVPADPKKPVTF